MEICKTLKLEEVCKHWNLRKSVTQWNWRKSVKHWNWRSLNTRIRPKLEEVCKTLELQEICKTLELVEVCKTLDKVRKTKTKIIVEMGLLNTLNIGHQDQEKRGLGSAKYANINTGPNPENSFKRNENLVGLLNILILDNRFKRYESLIGLLSTLTVDKTWITGSKEVRSLSVGLLSILYSIQGLKHALIAFFFMLCLSQVVFIIFKSFKKILV